MPRPRKVHGSDTGKRCKCGNKLVGNATACSQCRARKKASEDSAENLEASGLSLASVDDSDASELVDNKAITAKLFGMLSDIVGERLADNDIVEWAERVIRLPAGDGWRGNQRLDFGKYPLAAKILHMWKNPATERMVDIQGTQTGKSTIEMVILADSMLRSGGNLIYVVPTDALRDKIPKTKILPILEGSEELGFSKTEQSGKILRWKNGRYTWMALSTSPDTLADTSGCSTAIMTEFDESPDNMRHDPLALTFDRIRYSHRRKMFVNGTPRSLSSTGLYALYQQCKMYVATMPCPHCGEHMTIEKNDIMWPEGKDPKEIKRLKLAYVVCKSCGCEVADSHHLWMAEHADLKCITPDRSDLWVGIRIPSWFSAKMSFSETAFEFLEAQNDLVRLGDWYKSIAALPVDVFALNRIDEQFSYEDRRSIEWKREQREIPPHVKAITAGIDVGTGGYWFTMLGWGKDDRKYLLWSAFYEAKGIGYEPWEKAWEQVHKNFEPGYFNWLGHGPTPAMKLGIIDSGFDAPTVYSLCKNSQKWLPAKGTGGLKTLYMRTQADPERKHSGKFAGLPLVLHNSHHLQDMLENSLHTPIDNPHGFAFPADEGKRIFDHLRAAVKKEGGATGSYWEKTSKGAADHLRDALCLAVLAGEIMGLNKLSSEAEPATIEQRGEMSRPRPKKSFAGMSQNERC